MYFSTLATALALCAGPAEPEVPLPPPPPTEAGDFRPRGLPPPGAKAKGLRVTRIGVPEPRTAGKVAPRELAVLAQALVTEVRKIDGIAAVGTLEINEMLTQEHRRQMLGCEVDQECLAEIAGALGVDELIASELVVQDGLSTFTVTRIDMRTTRVLASAQKRLNRRRAGEEVLGVIGETVATLFKDRQLKPGETRGIAPRVARWLNPPPLPKWVFYSTAGAAALAGAGAGIYGLVSNSTAAQHNDLLKVGATVDGAALKQLERQAKDQRSRASVLAGAAGLLMVGATVEGFFTDWHDDRAAVTVGPGGATFHVRF